MRDLHLAYSLLVQSERTGLGERSSGSFSQLKKVSQIVVDTLHCEIGLLPERLADVDQLLLPVLHLADRQDEVVRLVQRREDLIPCDRHSNGAGDPALHFNEPQFAVRQDLRFNVVPALRAAHIPWFVAKLFLGFHDHLHGNEPRDVSAEKCGYDIESKVQADGKLRFIEVKGRVAGAITVTVTRNEILTALNKPDDFILAVGQVEDGQQKLVYIRKPFQQEPDFAVESINYNLQELLARGERPA